MAAATATVCQSQLYIYLSMDAVWLLIDRCWFCSMKRDLFGDSPWVKVKPVKPSGELISTYL